MPELLQELSYGGKNGYIGYRVFISLNHTGLPVTTLRLQSGYQAVTLEGARNDD